MLTVGAGVADPVETEAAVPASPSFGDYHRRHCHGGVAESLARSLFRDSKPVVRDSEPVVDQKIDDAVEEEWRKFDFPHAPSVASWLRSAPTWTLTIDQPCSGTAVADAIDAIEFERTPF